jgi:predicted enzyme related to lactoylglutathione lyase
MEQQPRPPEFLVNNPENLAGFYECVLGWRALDYDENFCRWTITFERTSAETRGKYILTEKKLLNAKSFIGVFDVDNIEKTTRLVIKNGGRLYNEHINDESDIINAVDSSKVMFFYDPQDNLFATVEHTKPVY